MWEGEGEDKIDIALLRFAQGVSWEKDVDSFAEGEEEGEGEEEESAQQSRRRRARRNIELRKQMAEEKKERKEQAAAEVQRLVRLLGKVTALARKLE